MIYIQEKLIEKFFDIAPVISGCDPLDAVIWIRPPVDDPENGDDEGSRSFIGYPLFSASNFKEEQPTDFFDTFPERTERIRFSKKFTANLKENISLIEDLCDSISLYFPDSPQWVACMYFTENIILVRDDKLLLDIKKISNKCSLQAPSWW